MSFRRRARLASLLLALAAIGCSGEPDEAQAPAAPGSARSAAAEPAPAAVPSRPRFFDVTEASGVRFEHDNGASGERYLPETMGPGVLIADFDGDSRQDLLFVNGRPLGAAGGRPSALYLNRGGMRFEDVSRAWGMPVAYCLGGAAADVDNDGDRDALLTCLERDLLLRNDGDRFTEVGAAMGLAAEKAAFSSSAVIFDADRDGWLDLYVGRYVHWTLEDDQYCDLFGRGKSYCTPGVYPGASDRFYRNLGGARFEDRTLEAGLDNDGAKTLGVAPLDYDGDGWTDLVLACDTTRNFLYHNLGDGTFEEVGRELGIAYMVNGDRGGGMGIDAADFSRSGSPGFAMTQFEDEMVALYVNQESAIFLDRGMSSEVGRNTMSTVGWGTFFFDFDLDGWLDLFVANGHLDPQADEAKGRAPWAQPQQLFWNRQGDFVEVTDTVAGDLALPRAGRGAAYADLDGDGDLDVVLTSNGGRASVFENRGESGHWLRLELRGTTSNRDGIGAQVSVRYGEVEQTASVDTGGSYLSQSQLAPTFGLGDVERVDEVVVRWPSGIEQRLADVEVDRVLALEEPASETAPSGR